MTRLVRDGLAQMQPSGELRHPGLLALLGITLNTTQIVGGANISLADAVILFLFVALLQRGGELRIPGALVAAVAFLLFWVTAVGSAIVPILFGVEVGAISVLFGGVKLLVGFGFLILGMNLTRSEVERVLMWYAGTVLVVCAVGIATSAAGLSSELASLYYANSRYRGLFNDPNYFAISACAAIPVVWRLRSMVFRVLSLLVVVGGVLVSGSKTGVVVLSLVLLGCVLASMRGSSRQRSAATVANDVLLLVVAVFIAFFAWSTIQGGLAELMSGTSIDRIASLFDEGLDTVSTSGSSRETSWSTALLIWTMSPFFGIGVGTYGMVADFLVGAPTIAHNTYLQVLIEWGTLIGGGVLVYIVALMIRSFRFMDSRSPHVLLCWFIVAVFLLGSFSVSFNNARILWFAIGVLVGAQLKMPALRADGIRDCRSLS